MKTLIRPIALNLLLVFVCTVLGIVGAEYVEGGMPIVEALGRVLVVTLLLSGFLAYLFCGPFDQKE